MYCFNSHFIPLLYAFQHSFKSGLQEATPCCLPHLALLLRSQVPGLPGVLLPSTAALGAFSGLLSQPVGNLLSAQGSCYDFWGHSSHTCAPTADPSWAPDDKTCPLGIAVWIFWTRSCWGPILQLPSFPISSLQLRKPHTQGPSWQIPLLHSGFLYPPFIHLPRSLQSQSLPSSGQNNLSPGTLWLPPNWIPDFTFPPRGS